MLNRQTQQQQDEEEKNAHEWKIDDLRSIHIDECLCVFTEKFFQRWLKLPNWGVNEWF